MPGPAKYMPQLRNTVLGRGGIARGIFDAEKTDPIEYDVLITESGDELTGETSEVNLAS